ncbi:rhomboid family intramembrane serine protease [Prolixibacter denitrificans]|uniref:Membrane associated rhomboid family serine protease n=1 Tax=Prolixibacter denitrificans TaxID=1541063 RepID=A0A2P8CKU6_9BACT|nr:rhomboid family intramembrane serine protease [Prolixibacter denitrificans]PSK85589.1 membrane associated rhomboid family serine protease [Prolixibacter denitrificans]GET20209.1 rhomboid family intramembrane serine protease [Prolixibacter denitrificans]
MGILEEIKLSFKNGSYLTRLIYLNIGVWVIIRLIYVILFLSGAQDTPVLSWLSLPSSFDVFLTRPWTIITYMFLHFQFFHILFNILWLYWFGRIFLEYHDQRKLLSLYLIGGVAGGLVYMLAYNFLPPFQGKPSELLGASAAVIAIVIAISVYVPNHVIHLMFIGPVKIKWIAVVSIIMYIIGLGGNNAGGDFAHLGGALWGWLYMSQLVKGRNVSRGFERVLDRFFTWFKPRKKLRVEHRGEAVNIDYDYNHKKKEQQEYINQILEKIGKSGYDSLTKEEKETLFRMGNKK